MDEVTLGVIGNQRIKWNIHHGARVKDISVRVRVFNMSPGREGLFLNLRTVALERTEETPIVFEIGVDDSRNPMGIKMITVGVVKLLVVGVVNKQHIRVRTTANNNAVHRMSLVI